MKRLINSCFLVLCLSSVVSCSLFKKSVELDLQPFSDNTSVLFQEAAKVDRPFQFKSLSIYKNIDKYGELKRKANPIIYGLKGIAYYSNQVVAISNAQLSEKGKNKQLTIYVKEVLERIEHRERMDSIGLSKVQIDSTISQIIRSETFLEGLQVADPVVKSIVLTMYERLEELEDLMEEVVVAFEDRIYQDYKLAIENYINFKNLQNTNQYILTQLYYAEVGKENTLDSILTTDKKMAKILPDATSMTKEQFKEAEAYLFQKLENIDRLLAQLSDDKIEFMDMKKEISAWHVQADEKIKITRNSLIVWSQAHKNLGQGIVTPPILGISTILDIVVPSVKSAL